MDERARPSAIFAVFAPHLAYTVDAICQLAGSFDEKGAGCATNAVATRRGRLHRRHLAPTMSGRKVFTARFPSSCEPTLCLLRRQMGLSRELTDDVVRARGVVRKSSEPYMPNVDVIESVFDGKRHGLERWWRENGTLWTEIPFVDGKRHGLARWWYENGTLWKEVPFVDDKRHGLDRLWHENGTISEEIPFVDDKRHGLERWWYENGTLRAKTPFVDDKRHGLDRWWNENGTLSEEISFVDDKRHGLERRWDDDGTLQQEVMYENGKRVSPKTNHVGK